LANGRLLRVDSPGVARGAPTEARPACHEPPGSRQGEVLEELEQV